MNFLVIICNLKPLCNIILNKCTKEDPPPKKMFGQQKQKTKKVIYCKPFIQNDPKKWPSLLGNLYANRIVIRKKAR